MCRQNQLFGCAMIAFGLGVLIGTWLESGFMCHCIGFGISACGVCVLRKR